MRRTVYWIIALFGLLTASKHAGADQAIYADSLANGWDNWSWCATDLGATAYVHGGVKSANVTYTGAWQGFYLHHNAFDTTLYSALTFWIHGGGVSGRSIQVQALLNGTAQAAVNLSSYVAGGSVSGSQWRQVTIPLSALGAQSKPDMDGFWLQDTSGGSQPAFYVDDMALVSVPAPNPVHLTVAADTPVRVVD
jgi:alpha-L-arabinofuranosidase